MGEIKGGLKLKQTMINFSRGETELYVARMNVNADISVDVYFAPNAPAGLESNWLPTGEDFFHICRLYGPERALFDKSWTLDDVEQGTAWSRSVTY